MARSIFGFGGRGLTKVSHSFSALFRRRCAQSAAGG